MDFNTLFQSSVPGLNFEVTIKFINLEGEKGDYINIAPAHPMQVEDSGIQGEYIIMVVRTDKPDEIMDFDNFFFDAKSLKLNPYNCISSKDKNILKLYENLTSKPEITLNEFLNDLIIKYYLPNKYNLIFAKGKY